MNKLPTLRNLVACNKVELAIQKFIEWAPANCSGHVDEGVMLAYRYASARGNSHTGAISWEERMQEEKSVVGDFMELLQTCEREQNDLMADDSPGESAASGNQNRTLVEIVLVGDLPDFPSRRQKLFLLLLGLILNIDFQQILIKKIQKGSIVLTLEMPRDSALELRHLFEEDAPELQPLLDEFTVLKTPQILAPEPAQRERTFEPGWQKDDAVQKITSIQNFQEIIAERGEEYATRLAYQLYFYKIKVDLKNKFKPVLPDDIIENAITDAFLNVLAFVKSDKELSTEGNSFFNFLYKLAFYSAKRHLRRSLSWKPDPLEDSAIENITEHDDARNSFYQKKLSEAIDQLKETERQILRLYFQGYSDAEIAQILHSEMSVNYLKKRRHEITQKLKKILKKIF